MTLKEVLVAMKQVSVLIDTREVSLFHLIQSVTGNLSAAISNLEACTDHDPAMMCEALQLEPELPEDDDENGKTASDAYQEAIDEVREESEIALRIFSE